MNSFATKTLTHIAVVLVFLGLAAIYFLPQLEGKVVQQSDIQQYRGMSQEVREFKNKTGETSLWTNAMFGGMPTYQINTIQAGNNLKLVDRVATLTIHEPIGRFFAAMVGFYILMMVLGVNPLLGAIGAVAFGFSTNNFILYEAGHITKLTTISYLPLIAAGLVLAFRKKYLLGGVLFALGMGLDVYANHPQMTYYFGLTLLIFGIAQLIYSIRKGEIVDFAKAAGVLILAAAIGVASAASNLLVTYEYAAETMRGEPILQNDATNGQQSSSEVEGLAWDYAMQWSNGTLDLFASFIPGVVGGGSQQPVGENSTFRQELVRQGYRVPAELSAPLYWGDLPFTSGPAYFGATVFFFFLLGLILVKGPVKWWLALGTLLTFMLSMGNNLEWFNRPIFDLVPLYNKFRTPNSVLSVTAFLVPMLGLLALNEVFSGKHDKRTIQRAVYMSGGIAGAIALFFMLLGPSFFDFTSAADQQYIQNYKISPDALPSDRKALMRGDAFRSFALVLLSAGLIWTFLQKWTQRNVVILGIGVLVLFDLWTVGRRYLNEDSFVPKINAEAAFQPRQVDDVIRKDGDPNFRVLDLTQNDPFASSFTSYFHKSIGGYHAAKLQRYQDIIDRHLRKNNERVFNMLNTKYFIIPGQSGQAEMQINMAALGNAWFVGDTRMVDTPNQEIDVLNEIDPATTAAIHKEFSDYLAGLNLQLDSTATIELTDYKPNHLTYQSNASREQLAVFSEIWYGPNKGWQAYIDGEPVEHIRANYILRVMRVPAGQHKIEFIFAPKTYERGKLISTIFSSLILVGLLGVVGYKGYQSYQKAKNEPRPTPTQAPASDKTTKTTATGRSSSRTKKKKK